MEMRPIAEYLFSIAQYRCTVQQIDNCFFRRAFSALKPKQKKTRYEINAPVV
jgi:hypothetical protein